MKLILKNSTIQFESENVLYSWYGIEESVLSTFERQYSSDAVARGIDYGDKKVKGAKFFMLNGGTIRIYAGKLNSGTINLIKEVNAVSGWNEVNFENALPADTKVVFNGAGLAYETSVSTSVAFKLINTEPGMSVVTPPIVENESGTIPAIRLLMQS